MVNGVESAALELTEPSATADFAFGASLQAPYSAVFPSSIYKDAATVTLPAQQEAAEGSFHAQASPMLAYGSEKNLVFAHPFAVVKVTVRTVLRQKSSISSSEAMQANRYAVILKWIIRHCLLPVKLQAQVLP